MTSFTVAKQINDFVDRHWGIEESGRKLISRNAIQNFLARKTKTPDFKLRAIQLFLYQFGERYRLSSRPGRDDISQTAAALSHFFGLDDEPRQIRHRNYFNFEGAYEMFAKSYNSEISCFLLLKRDKKAGILRAFGTYWINFYDADVLRQPTERISLEGCALVTRDLFALIFRDQIKFRPLIFTATEIEKKSISGPLVVQVSRKLRAWGATRGTYDGKCRKLTHRVAWNMIEEQPEIMPANAFNYLDRT